MIRLRAPLLLAVWVVACAPALDWRRVRFDDMGLEAQFPCKPAGHERTVQLAGRRLPMVMHGCAAEGGTYVVGSLALDDVRDVTAMLQALRDAAARNLMAGAGTLESFPVPGMTPNAHAGRAALTGRRPDGSAVVRHLLLFTRGQRVYQASVLGDRPPEAAVQTFFAGLRLAA